MSCSTQSDASSPQHFSFGSDGSEFGDVETPITERSLLFDDEFLGITGPSSALSQYILVVGGCGFIGSHTVWELAKAGYNVVVVDNLSNAFSDVFTTIEGMVNKHYEDMRSQQPVMRLYTADYRDTEAMTTILRNYERPLQHQSSQSSVEDARRSYITGVIHFAAFKSVGDSIKHPLKYYANNVGGLIDFCSLLGDFGVKNFVFSSSATVYGTVADMGVPLREEYCSQDTIAFVDDDGQQKFVQSGSSGLTNPYGRTKWMCEAILNDLANADPEWIITALRYFNPIGCDESGLIGEDPRDAATNLMPVVLRVINGALPVLSVYGSDWDTPDGTAVRDYIHVTDLARGHLAALKSRPDRGFKVYNLGSGRGSSVLELVAAMERVCGRTIPKQLVGRRAGDVGSCVAKADRAKQELNWQTEKTLDECCIDVWRFLERTASHSLSDATMSL